MATRDELQGTLDEMLANDEISGEQYKQYSIKVQNGERLSLDDLSTIHSQRSDSAPVASPSNPSDVQLMSPDEWNKTYGGGRKTPYDSYNEYVEATISEAKASGATVVPSGNGIAGGKPVSPSNMPNPRDPGTMDHYNVGAGVALAQEKGEQYYYGYGASDDPRAGTGTDVHMPGTIDTKVSSNAITPPPSTTPDAVSSAAPKAPQAPADIAAPKGGDNAQEWIQERTKAIIDENGGNWTTEALDEQGRAQAQTQAVNEYNARNGKQIDEVKGTITETEVDASGNVVKTTTKQYDPDMNNLESTTVKEKNSNGTTTTTTRADGSTTVVETRGNQTIKTDVDKNGNKTVTTTRGSAQGAIVTTESYDSEGRLSGRTEQKSSAYGNTTKTTAVDRAAGTVTETETDGKGNVVKSTTTQYDTEMNNASSTVTVSQDGNNLKVSYSSDREGKTNNEVSIDFEKFVSAYDQVKSLVNAASAIPTLTNVSGLNTLACKDGGALNTSKLTGMKCMNGACGRGGNIAGVANTMHNVVNAIVAFDDDSAAIWDKYNQESNEPEEFAGDLSEDAGSTATETTEPVDAGTEVPTDYSSDNNSGTGGAYGPGSDYNPGTEKITEATTKITEEEKMKLLTEQLGVDMDDLANGAKYVTYGKEFDGINIYYDNESTTQTSIANRMLNILNYFGRISDDKQIVDANGNKITSIKEDTNGLTFKYKKNGKEHTLTLKINNELEYKGNKYSGIQVIVNK